MAGPGTTYSANPSQEDPQRTSDGIPETHEQPGSKYSTRTQPPSHFSNSQYGDSALPEWTLHQEALESAVEEALNEFLSMRSIEGEALSKDMGSRLQTLSDLLEIIAPIVPEQAPTYRQTLLKRLKEAGLDIDLEDDRVLREIALYAEKCDVAEELTRLQSHIEQMQQTLAEEGTIGRKLEFLLQEIFREFNTLGNKSSNLQLIQSVLEAKAEVEKLREQALNVE